MPKELTQAEKEKVASENPAELYENEQKPDRHGRYSVVQDSNFGARFGAQHVERSRFRFL